MAVLPLRCIRLRGAQVTQLTKGFTLMERQLKQAEDGLNNPEGDRFAEVVKPFLAEAKVREEKVCYRDF